MLRLLTFLIVMFALACCTGMTGCGSAGEAAIESPVDTSAIRRGDFERTLLLTGELEAVRSTSSAPS